MKSPYFVPYAIKGLYGIIKNLAYIKMISTVIGLVGMRAGIFTVRSGIVFSPTDLSNHREELQTNPLKWIELTNWGVHQLRWNPDH